MTRWLPWLLLVVALGACGVLAYLLELARGEAATTRRAAEVAELEAEGLAVVHEATAAELAERTRRLLAAEGALGEELARALRVSPGARPVAVLSASTGPVVAEGLPRYAESSPDGDRPLQVGGSDGVQSAPCLLAPGDRAEVRVDSVALRSDGGTIFAVGEASAYRWKPEPETRIIGGVFYEPLTDVSVLAPPAPKWLLGGWGLGLTAMATSHGLGAGVLVAAPPVRPWDVVQLEPSASIGRAGGTVVGVSLVAR